MNTKTFGFGEREKLEQSITSTIVSVEYCAYCGQKAQVEDVGSTHNHRWEEEIIHYCDCEKAEKEKELKKQISELNNKKFHLERDLKQLQESEENNLHIREKKAELEIQQIKRKYKLE